MLFKNKRVVEVLLVKSEESLLLTLPKVGYLSFGVNLFAYNQKITISLCAQCSM